MQKSNLYRVYITNGLISYVVFCYFENINLLQIALLSTMYLYCCDEVKKKTCSSYLTLLDNVFNQLIDEDSYYKVNVNSRLECNFF